MPDLRTLSRGMQLAGASAILLLLDTILLDWQSVDLGVVSAGRSAWHGFWGVLLGLLTIAFIAWLAARLFAVKLPELPVPARTITLVLGGLILVFAVLKVLTDDFRAWPAWVGILLAAGCAAGAWLLSQEPEPVATTTDYAPPPSSPPPPAADPTPPSEGI